MIDNTRLGPTRLRDIAVVVVIAAVAGYLLLRFSYSRLPPLPRLAGLPAGVIGIGLALAGVGMRRRLRDGAAERELIDALRAARTLAVAKAGVLAAAAFGGLWIGAAVELLPSAGQVTAASRDLTTSLIGLGCAGLMLAGGLFLENSCRTPDSPGESQDQ